MSPVPKHRVGTPPNQVIKEILQTNLTPESPPPLANRGVKNQAPHITWLADSNPNLLPHLILPTKEGTIYAVRNIANQLTTSMGSVDYGVLMLHTPVLLITDTSNNETIQTLLTHPETLPDSTRQELHHLFTPFRALQTLQGKKTLSLARQQKILTEKNIDYQVSLAVERYRNRIRAGRLMVIGSILDTNNTYKHGKGRLIIININGESSSQQLHKNKILRNISPTLLKGIGRELPQ